MNLMITLISILPYLGFILLLHTVIYLNNQNVGNNYPYLNNQYDSVLNKSFRIAFWSCNRQKMENPFWKHMDFLAPNGIIWMGDNIYADMPETQFEVARIIALKFILNPLNTLLALFKKAPSIFETASVAKISKGYSDLQKQPYFEKIKNIRNLVFEASTWDDHDYGINDGDKTYVNKWISKELYLKFFNASKDDSRFKQNGVYQSHIIELYSDFILKDKIYYSYGLRTSDLRCPSKFKLFYPKNTFWRISLITLDVRFNKDPWSVGVNGDFLGEEQWSWLESQVCNSTSNIHIIVSSIQVLPKKRILETWSGFPKSQERLLNLLRDCKTSHPIFLSGDVHYSEINKYDVKDLGYDSNEVLWDVTSSGMTHAVNQFPVGGGWLVDQFVRNVLSSPNVKRKPDGFAEIFTKQNIGILDIIFDNMNSLYLDIQILNKETQVVIKHKLKASQKCENSWCLLKSVDF